MEIIGHMSCDFCPGCGIEHHWLACPEVSQSVFDREDPDWIQAEMTDLEDELRVVTDPELRRQMMRRYLQLRAACGTPVGPWWGRVGQSLSHDRTEAVFGSEG